MSADSLQYKENIITEYKEKPVTQYEEKNVTQPVTEVRYLMTMVQT